MDEYAIECTSSRSLRSRSPLRPSCSFFFFNDTATTEIYTLSLHDALPIYLRSVVLLGLVVSLVLSSVISLVILPPTRALLRRLCPLEDAVAFWTRFTVLMLFLGPLLVTLIFGVPYSELSSKLTATDLIVRVISAALVGSFLTLGGIGLRIGTLRHPVGGSLPPPKRTDDERLR